MADDDGGDEAQHIRDAQAGNPDAFGWLCAKYQPAVFSLVLSMCGHEHTAQDLAQEAFLRAFRGIKTYRFASDSFLIWLKAVARNVVKTAKRRRERESPADPTDPAGAIMAQRDEKQPDPADDAKAVREKVIETLLSCCLRSLDPDSRKLLEMHYLEEKTLDEACEALGLTGNRSNRARTARDRVKDHFARCHPELAALLEF